MASTSKTQNLNLNSWIGSDKPQMADFNSDNAIIDEKLGGHLDNETIHLTSDEKNLLGTYCTTGSYVGNGAFDNFYSLDFTPTAVLIMRAGYSAVSYDEVNNKIGACFGIAINGKASASLEIVENGVQINNQTNALSGNVYNGLNVLGAQYLIIAFK